MLEETTTEAAPAATEIDYPKTKGEALKAFKVGSSGFLRGLVLALYGWSLSKLAPEFAAVYGGTVQEAMDKGVDKLRHGLGVYVSALYHGLDVPGPVDAAAMSRAFGGFVVKAILIRDQRIKMGRAAERKHVENRKAKAGTLDRRKRERQARKANRR